MKKIVLPTDFSENSKRAIAYALNLFHHEGSEFVLLHSYRPPHSAGMLVSIDEFVEKDAKEGLELQMKYIKEDLGFSTERIKTIARYGFAKDVINSVAADEEADLIIMGTKGASGLKEVVIGSNTAHIIENTIIPVIAVPEEAKLDPPAKVALAIDFDNELKVSSLNPLLKLLVKFNALLSVINIKEEDDEENVINQKREELDKFFLQTRHSFHFLDSDDVEDGISKFVAENDINLLTMVPRKFNFFEKLFHRSLTKTMANHIKIPLLAIHSE